MRECLLAALLLAVSALQVAPSPASTDSPLTAIPKNNYPVRMGYVDRVTEWWPANKLAAGLGVPGFTDEKIYNYIALGYWKCGDLAIDAARAWSRPVDYFGNDSVFGPTKADIQASLRKRYNDAKSQVLVSAFGSVEQPTSAGFNPLDCANQLGGFVLDNNLDGCDISYQDMPAFQSGTAERWLNVFQTQLRKLLPNHTIVHSVGAGLFRGQLLPQGGYVAVNSQVGVHINFYSVQYYNQSYSKFETYIDIFEKNAGTAVMELLDKGVPLKKIVVAKPVTPSDSTSGYISAAVLGASASAGYDKLYWFAGIALWQYSSDVRGNSMLNAAGHLKELCATNKDCK